MSVKVFRDNAVCYLTLNRPEVFNSFNRQMALDLQKQIEICQEDDDIRVVVLSGEGKAFCAGQDLAEVVDPNGPKLTDIIKDHYNPIIQKIQSLKKPIISAVNGVAAGAGANIALACDIVIASRSASFIQAFSKIGLIPDSGGTYFLPRLIGVQKALALMLTGEKIMADEAERIGMIYKVYDDNEFQINIELFAKKMAEMPTYGLSLTKIAVQQGIRNDLNTQLSLEEELQTKAGNSMDFKEGVQAFLEKRKPKFLGK